jgi:hypothetical protein
LHKHLLNLASHGPKNQILGQSSKKNKRGDEGNQGKKGPEKRLKNSLDSCSEAHYLFRRYDKIA